MRFSVIIPCHNAARWIRQTLQSVADQRHAPHEVIVIDDASTDDSIEVIRASGVEVMLLRTRSGNAAGARNAGIERATGNWVALLDADDIWYPNHLEDAAALLRDSADVAYCAGHEWMELDGQRKPLPPCYWRGYPDSRKALHHDAYIDLMTKSLHFGHSTVIYHRDRLMEVGAFDIAQKRRHDIDLWLRMIHDHTWTYAAGPAAAYRYETPGSISRNTVEVAYYALRALHKNLPLFSDNRQYAALVEQHAKRGMSVAFNDADSDIETKLRKLAWPLLTGGYKAFYAGARACPPVFKALVRIKRNTYNVLRRRARHAREQAELNQFT